MKKNEKMKKHKKEQLKLTHCIKKIREKSVYKINELKRK